MATQAEVKTDSELAGRCGAEPWLSKIPGTDIYALVGPDGYDIGYVRKFYRTIQKDIPGKMYVAWRRTAKTPSWRHWLKGEMEPRGGRYCPFADTRKQAVDRLLRDAQGIEAQRATTVEQGVVHESPVGNADAPQHREG